MKLILVNISRIIVGALFVFSGLVKAIDPLGLAYKMQEFFEAWSSGGFMPAMMHGLSEHAVTFSIVMIALEVVAGVALLVGWQRKFAVWFLLLLVLFFTFLTAYVLFSGKIRACGCFGDCIPLTPVQTFSKDILLLLLSLLLVFNWRLIRPLAKPWIAGTVVLASLVLTLFLQFYVQRHLPVKDCLPFKTGNNILELRKMPKDAVPDKFDYVFVYEKDGVKKEFTVNALPDSTWKFADRKQILIQKGKNNIPLINDFSFTTASGNDTTEAIMLKEDLYYILYVKDLAELPETFNEDLRIIRQAKDANIPLYVVTSKRAPAEKRYSGTPVFTIDYTALKTVARSNPTLYKMKSAVVEKKWGSADLVDVVISP